MELQSGLKKVASYRRKLPRKAKNIYLPTEVWVDVFCYQWISRPEMGKIVPQIGNRWFGEQLQFYLHEWGKHTLGNLYFFKQGVMNCPNSGHLQQLEYPQTVLPENIKFSKSFEINHFDNQVYNFFRRIQNVLTADTKLYIRYISYFEEEFGNVRTILGHLLPFIDGIHTIYTDDWMLPVVLSFPPEKFHNIKVLDVRLHRPVQSAIKPTMEWLASSNEPKLLLLCCYENEIAQQVLETIRKQFMEATEPSTFAVIFRYDSDLLEFECSNAIGEKLCGMRNESWKFEVFRHQANAEAGAKLREWLAENGYNDGLYDNPNGCIEFMQPNIGPGRIFALPVDDEQGDEKEDKDEEKPSTSNKSICK